MTSISATSSQNYQTPLQKLQAELQSEITSGAIGASDQTALSSALTDIDTLLKSDQTASSTTTPQSPPTDLKSKIDTLIAGEVSSGKLTASQAAELQNVFKNAFAGGPGGPGHTHGHHHGGGGSAADASASTDGTDGTDSAAGSSGSTSTDDVLQQFLQTLQQSLASSSTALYGATGATSITGSNSTSLASLLLDYQT
jgi:hypothetical protein